MFRNFNFMRNLMFYRNKYYDWFLLGYCAVQLGRDISISTCLHLQATRVYSIHGGRRMLRNVSTWQPSEYCHFYLVPEHVSFISQETLRPQENVLTTVCLLETWLKKEKFLQLSLPSKNWWTKEMFLQLAFIFWRLYLKMKCFTTVFIFWRLD